MIKEATFLINDVSAFVSFRVLMWPGKESFLLRKVFQNWQRRYNFNSPFTQEHTLNNQNKKKSEQEVHQRVKTEEKAKR